jgi:hypothetical protein
MLFEYGKRLDQLDYERLWTEKNWYFSDAIIMLTSYEMEIRGFYSLDDSKLTYAKIHGKYESYLLESMLEKLFEYNDGVDPDLKASYASEISDLTTVNPSRSTFNRYTFLNFLEANYPGNIDIDRLKRFLSGEEAPLNTKPHASKVEEQSRIVVQTTNSDLLNNQGSVDSSGITHIRGTGADASHTLGAAALDGHKYCFERITQSWKLRFMDIELNGVKDLVGMDYIQLLLKNPGIPIGVYEIQSMLNPIGIKSPEGRRRPELEIFEGHTTAKLDNNNTSKNKETRSSKSKSLENLKRRLQKLSQERNELDSDYDHIEIEAIDNEYAKIEAAVDNILYAKNDDPEIKNNRDKVAKAIKAAIKNISGLKTTDGQPSTPLSNFLTQHIKTASECVYNPPTINPPDWSF